MLLLSRKRHKIWLSMNFTRSLGHASLARFLISTQISFISDDSRFEINPRQISHFPRHKVSETRVFIAFSVFHSHTRRVSHLFFFSSTEFLHELWGSGKDQGDELNVKFFEEKQCKDLIEFPFIENSIHKWTWSSIQKHATTLSSPEHSKYQKGHLLYVNLR